MSPNRQLPASERAAVDRVLHAAAEWFGLTVPVMVGRSRDRPAFMARQVAAWVLHDKIGLSYSQIGRILGRDHTTVMASCEKIRQRQAQPVVLEALATIAGSAAPSSIPPPEEPDARAALRQRVVNDFRYHPPSSPAVVRAHEVVRAVLGDAALALLEVCPPGRELSTALSRLEEAAFWANAAVARTQRTVLPVDWEPVGDGRANVIEMLVERTPFPSTTSSGVAQKG